MAIVEKSNWSFQHVALMGRVQTRNRRQRYPRCTIHHCYAWIARGNMFSMAQLASSAVHHMQSKCYMNSSHSPDAC